MKYAALIFAILAVVFGTLYFMKTKELNETVASLTNKANQLEVSVAEKDSQIATLNGQVSTLTDEVTDKSATIETLNGQVSTLTDEVTDKSATIETLHGTISERNAEISTLNMNSNLRKWQIDQLTTNLSEKSETIRTLNDTVESYKLTLGAMGEYNREIEGLLIEASDLLSKIGELNSNVDSVKENNPPTGLDKAVSPETVENDAPSEGEEIPPETESTIVPEGNDETVPVQGTEEAAQITENAENATTDEVELKEFPERSFLCEAFLKTLEANQGIEDLVKASIAKAAEINPDQATNPVQSLDAFYDYIDSMITRIPEVQGENFVGRQEMQYLEWLLDQPLEDLENSGLLRPTVSYLKPVMEWMEEVSNTWNVYLQSEASWNPMTYETLLEIPAWNLDKGWYEDANNWKSLNDFISRKLSGPEARPIAAPEDESVVVAPVDSASREMMQIGENGVIASETGEVPVEEILGQEGAEAAPLFHGGILTHLTLNDTDYHRFHSPVSGTVKAVYLIPRPKLHGIVMNWDSEKNQIVRDSSSLFWVENETRGVVLIETAAGMVALIPCGMGQISSLELDGNIQSGTELKKGDEIGTFLFGGADFFMLFEKKTGFTLTEAQKEGHLLCGEEFGRFLTTVTEEDTPSATPDEALSAETTESAPAVEENTTETTESTPAAEENATETTESAPAAEENATETTESAPAAEENTTETAEPVPGAEENGTNTGDESSTTAENSESPSAPEQLNSEGTEK